LSLRDPYFILVIVTTGVMILQQKLMTPMTTTEASGSQKYMGYLFPLVMAFFLYNFPAGLWLYYLLTTLAQIGQQLVVNREIAQAEVKTVPAVESDSGTAPQSEEESDGREDTSGD